MQLTKKNRSIRSLAHTYWTELRMVPNFPTIQPWFSFSIADFLESFHETLGFSRVSRLYREHFVGSCESSDFIVCLLRRGLAHQQIFLNCFLPSNMFALFLTFSHHIVLFHEGLENVSNFLRIMWRHFSLRWHFLISFVFHSFTHP